LDETVHEMVGLGLIAIALLLAGCQGASGSLGLDAELQIPDTQFVPGAPPARVSGPSVVSMSFPVSSVTPGSENQPLLGALDPAATAVAVRLVGDRGYYVVPAGVPATEAPTEPTFKAALSFSRALAPGARTLEVRAVDASQRFGAPATQTLSVTEPPAPAGALVISLKWDTNADLDLHVIDPNGLEIWSGQMSGDGGQLDFDSNSGCIIDGRNQENVIFGTQAPPGPYVVRVDTFSLCGQPYAGWEVHVTAAGMVPLSASGTSYDSDTRGAHGAGAGLTVLTFDLP
jgi:uncharacterized protein YfaP (DUF2135 family)